MGLISAGPRKIAELVWLMLGFRSIDQNDDWCVHYQLVMIGPARLGYWLNLLFLPYGLFASIICHGHFDHLSQLAVEDQASEV